MAFEAIVKISVQTSCHTKPVLHMISHFSPGCPISCLTERHILYQVIRVHEKRTAINQHRQIRIRIIVQFLRYRNVLFAFDTHGWTDSIADHNYVMWQEGIRFLCVNFLVIFRLIHIKGITLAIPYVGLRREFSGLESGRYPAL